MTTLEYPCSHYKLYLAFTDPEAVDPAHLAHYNKAATEGLGYNSGLDLVAEQQLVTHLVKELSTDLQVHDFGFGVIAQMVDVRTDHPAPYELRARSSTYKHGLWPAPGVGTIDMDYLGELRYKFIAPRAVQYIGPARLCQVVAPDGYPFAVEITDLATLQARVARYCPGSTRGAAGFGSTGTH